MQSPQRAYIQTAQGPIAYNPAMASAAAGGPLASGITSQGVGTAVPATAYGMGMGSGVGTGPAAAGLGFTGTPHQNHYSNAGGIMASQSGAAGRFGGFASQPGMGPSMPFNPLGSTLPTNTFSPRSPQSMWADSSRAREINEEQHEEGDDNDEAEGNGGLFGCCFNKAPRTPSTLGMLKAEKRRERAERVHEEREKKLREKHEEVVREGHMERMREKH